jgi:hypothetical protein
MIGDALKPRTCDPAAFPTTGTWVDKARFAVRCTLLAPSSHNTQPWKFAIIGNELLIMADRLRSPPVETRVARFPQWMLRLRLGPSVPDAVRRSLEGALS